MLRISGVLILLISLQSAIAADFCIHPNGSQVWPNCQTTNGLCSPGGACSLSAANSSLSSGDRALLMGGAYSDKIRPTRSGDSDSSRIIYQAYDETDVILTNCAGSAKTERTAGAINLDLKEWISVLGRPPGQAPGSGPQRIQVQPTVKCAVGLSACGARYGHISDIIVESCKGEFEYKGGANPACTNRAISRLASYCMYAFNQPWARPTEYILTEHSLFRGNLDGSNNCSSCTYDNFSAERGNRYLVFRNNEIDSAVHANLKLSDAGAVGHLVTGNRNSSYWHTGSTLYQSGKNNADRNRADMLWEQNYVTATFETPALPHSQPGNALQIGGGPLLRYNVIAEANSLVKRSSAHATMGASYGESSSKENSCGGIYAYHNTFVNSGGSAIRCNTPGWNPGTSHQSQYGLSYFANNLYWNVSNIKHDSIFYYGNPNNPSIVLLDRYINNKIGRSISNDYNKVFFIVGFGGSTLANARATWDGSDQTKPIVTDWHGFANEYITNLDSWFVDYAGKDYRLTSQAPAIDAGAPIAQVSSNDSGVGPKIAVEPIRAFWSSCSAYAAHPWMGVHCDEICIGNDARNVSSAVCGVQITAVDYSTGEITVQNPPNRAQGAFIWIYKDSQKRLRISGTTTDVGAFEYQSGSIPPPPINIRPVIREVQAIGSPTNQLSNTWIYEIIDPDSSSFTMQWFGPCQGPVLASSTGQHTDFVTVPGVGVYDNCSVVANDGQDNSDILTISQFEVVPQGGEPVPPVVTVVSPIGNLPKNTRQTELRVDTDIAANCRFNVESTDWRYLIPFPQTGNTMHTYQIAITPGLVQWYGVQCESASSGARSKPVQLYVYAPK